MAPFHLSSGKRRRAANTHQREPTRLTQRGAAPTIFVGDTRRKNGQIPTPVRFCFRRGRAAGSDTARPGEPTDTGFQELRKLGVEIVVNFRNERGEIEAERRTVERLGLRYVSIPWGASHNPTSQQVADFLEVLQANPESKIFVHCHRGADRTGTMVAAYRIAEQHWAPPQAIQEMRAYHYHHFWWPNLQRYVEDFPRLLATDPKLRAFAPATHATAP